MHICKLPFILRFLAEFSTKLQKDTFLDNLRTITQKGKESNDFIFSSTFSTLTTGNMYF